MNCNALVLVNTSSKSNYEKYRKYIRPYLNYFGFSFSELDIRECRDLERLDDYALYLVGHKGVITDLPAEMSARLMTQIRSGSGIVSFNDWTHSAGGAEYRNADRIDIIGRHYITALHDADEPIHLYQRSIVSNCLRLDSGTVLASASGMPVLEVAFHGKGKIVLWHNIQWISHDVLGPVHGMDDLFWRSMVWAARKPFLMQGIPPLLSMRVDDVWGAGRGGNRDDPFYWVEVCNKYGIRPWLGLFPDNMRENSIAQLKKITDAGNAEVFPHAFSGESVKTGDPAVSEEWIYFDHKGKREYSEDLIRENIVRTTEWMGSHSLPISKVALGHYYEIGKNALPYLKDWGCEFIGMHMKPGQSYSPDGDWLVGGPYRLYESGKMKSAWPVFYAHYLEADGMPSSDLYNIVVEIRDIAGYEWAPDNDVNGTVRRGFAQLKRAFDSMVPAVLFTHESDHIQYINPETWEEIIGRIVEACAAYKPEYTTLEESCRYMRARQNIRIVNVEFNNGKLHADLRGKNDMPTKCYVFLESPQGEIQSMLTDIPALSGDTCVEVDL